MKQLKLEVGKTYRSREGKEVKITSCDGGYSHPYRGSDGDWYAESGKWSSYGKEHPHDLIEEVTVSDANQKHNEMEVLILQVGKTYVNRRGEEVRIVENDGGFGYSYRGNNGELYTESGKWWSKESPNDLIEEVPSESTRHTFTIPEGTKGVNVSKVGNRIVVEMVPEKDPNPGDVCINDLGSVYIFQSVAGKTTHRHYAWLGREGRVVLNESAIAGRPATPEEAQPLWDALKKAGKRWNAEAMQVEDVPESDRIREWLRANFDYHLYAQGDVVGAISRYLKHREGEK